MINMTKTPMADLQKTAKLSLAKHGLEADGKGGIKVRLVLDHSGSMSPWYRAGAVQRLTEQVLGLASALDDDGTIEVWYFGSGVSAVHEVSLSQTDPGGMRTESRRSRLFGRSAGAVQPAVDPYYVGWVDRTHPQQHWGSTNYASAINAAAAYRRENHETEPSLVIFQTDGGPDSRGAANEALRAVSGEDVFYAFVAFGEDDAETNPQGAAAYMHSLNTLSGRVRDNASTYIAGSLETYASVPDSVVYDGVLGEFVGQWLPQVL